LPEFRLERLARTRRRKRLLHVRRRLFPTRLRATKLCVLIEHFSNALDHVLNALDERRRVGLTLGERLQRRALGEKNAGWPLGRGG